MLHPLKDGRNKRTGCSALLRRVAYNKTTYKQHTNKFGASSLELFGNGGDNSRLFYDGTRSLVCLGLSSVYFKMSKKKEYKSESIGTVRQNVEQSTSMMWKLSAHFWSFWHLFFFLSGSSTSLIISSPHCFRSVWWMIAGNSTFPPRYTQEHFRLGGRLGFSFVVFVSVLDEMHQMSISNTTNNNNNLGLRTAMPYVRVCRSVSSGRDVLSGTIACNFTLN